LILESELRDWIPIDGTEDFAGNVLRYGAGVSYLTHQWNCWSLRPVVEAVGWTVLDGRKTHVNGIFDADGDTVVNLKAGLRLNSGQGVYGSGRSLYIGYGRALTGDVWYSDIARLEMRFSF
jgi:hypothetical protein